MYSAVVVVLANEDIRSCTAATNREEKPVFSERQERNTVFIELLVVPHLAAVYMAERQKRRRGKFVPEQLHLSMQPHLVARVQLAVLVFDPSFQEVHDRLRPW